MPEGILAKPLPALSSWVGPRRNVLASLGAGLASGRNFGDGVANALRGLPGAMQADDQVARMEQEEQERQAAIDEQMRLRARYSDFFRGQGENELADLVGSEAGPEPGDLYWKWRQGASGDPSETPSGRARLAAEYGITGDALNRYVLTGEYSAGSPTAPSLTEIYTEGGGAQKGYMSPDGFVPVGSEKPAPAPKAEFNVSQASAAGYADRMVQSDAIISDPKITAASMDFTENNKNNVWLIGNNLTSSEFKQADQAKRDFINAIMRRESGAVISDSEFANANKQYFPQFGDDEATLNQKAANRRNAIKGVARAAGPSYELPDTTNYLTSPPSDDITDLLTKYAEQ